MLRLDHAYGIVMASGTGGLGLHGGGTPFDPAQFYVVNGGRISGATTNAVTIANAQPTDAANYALRVSNTAGAVTSAVATLTVIAPPAIASQPVTRRPLTRDSRL